jgi:hypothetical protein
MDRSGRLAPSSPGRVAMAVAVALLAGCTMCPDPFDYSGPVPNGSAPQNDFRARSNGILPIDAAPKPWPPIVRTPGGKHDAIARADGGTTGARRREPTLAVPEAAVATVIAESDEATEEAVSVLVAETDAADPLPPAHVDVDDDAMPLAAEAADTNAAGDPDLDEDPVSEGETDAEPFLAAAAVQDEVESPVMPEPEDADTPSSLPETPGWRRRR